LIWTFIENTINHLLALDATAKNRLKLLDGKNLEINILGNIISSRIYCLFNVNAIHLNTITSQPSDILVTGNSRAFLKLVLNKDFYLATRLGLTFEGDPILLETVQHLFFRLDVDWEEILSRCTGDIIAHQLGDFVRYTRKKQQTLLTNTARSLAEYLQEESKLSPTHIEVDNFMNAVDKLRARIERLEMKAEYMFLEGNKDIAR